MPKRLLTGEQRAAILADVRAGGTCRGIARAHGVAPSTVTRIAAEGGITDAFERSITQKGARAAAFDAAAARAQLHDDLLRDAQRFRARAWSSYEQVLTGPEGPSVVVTNLPPLRDQQAAYTAIAIAIDKADKLAAKDDASGATAVDSWLAHMLGGGG